MNAKHGLVLAVFFALATPGLLSAQDGGGHSPYTVDYQCGEMLQGCSDWESCGEPCYCRQMCGNFWARTDLLYWFLQGYETPALITDNSGETLFGGDRLNTGGRLGVRMELGAWLDDCQTCGVFGDFIYLGDNDSQASVVSTPTSPVFRPFINTDPNAPGQTFQLADRIDVDTDSLFYTGGIALRRNLCCCFDECGNGRRLDYIVGYRHLRLNESILIQEQASFQTTQFLLEDYFETDNRFHGVEFGLLAQRYHGPWSIDLLGKVALGNNHQSVLVTGGSTTSTPGGPTIQGPGGLLAQPTNIGEYTSDQFAFIPQAYLNIGYQLTPCVRLLGGYSFLWVSNAVRPGDQIDPNVDGRFLNPNLVPPFTPPATGPLPPNTETSSFWVQGVNVGLEISF